MSGETQDEVSGWTIDTLAQHMRTLREADLRFDAERDRRYAEVALEREKALKIKETADLAALQLAREIQTYKDEKANELRSQIERERGTYLTRADKAAIEAQIKPLADYVTGQLTVREHTEISRGLLALVVSAVVATVVVVNVIIALATRL
jgi:hypothetical protein